MTPISYNELINKISSTTFAVYLIHTNRWFSEILFEHLLHLSAFSENSLLYGAVAIFTIPICFLMAFILDPARVMIAKIIPIENICLYVDKKYNLLFGSD